jgi:hypothetical protein
VAAPVGRCQLANSFVSAAPRAPMAAFTAAVTQVITDAHAI